MVNGLAEEAAAEAAELLGRVGCEEARDGRRGCALGDRDGGGDLGGGDFSRVNDAYGCGQGGFDRLAQEGVVGASEQEGVRLERGGAGLMEELREIDAEDLAGDGVVDPAFFNEWNEQGAGLLNGAEISFGTGGGVSVAFDGGGGGDDHDIAGAGVGLGGVGSCFDDAEDGHGDGGADIVECERRSGVAGDDEEFGALVEEEFGGGDSVAGDGFTGFCAVGQARGVAEVEEFGSGNVTEQGL